MLKVGFVTSSLSSEDGWGRYSKSLAEEVSRFSEVRVLTHSSANNHTFLKNVSPVLPDFAFSLSAQAKTLFNAMKYLRGCDVIHSLVEPFAPGAAMASKLLGAKFIMTLHGTYAVPPKDFSVRRGLMKFAYRTASITTTGSKYTEAKVRESINGLGECRFIPNGVDSAVFRQLDAKNGPGNFLLTVGALKPRKGADVFLKAFALIKDDFPSLRCKLVGDNRNTKFISLLEDLTKKHNIEGRVDYLGIIDDRELVNLYNGCTLFVLAARDIEGNFEGFPMVFYEANACGAPVVTTGGFGSEYAIKDWHNGVLVDSEDFKAMAGSIKKILSDTKLYSDMCDNSLREAEKHTWDNIVHGILQMYSDALTKD